MNKQDVMRDLLELLDAANAMNVYMDSSEPYKEAVELLEDLNIKYLVERGEPK